MESLEGAQAGHRILRLNGPLTLANLFDFQAMVRSDQAPRTIIDLTAVPYIDSAGIGALLGAHVSRQKDGRSLALVGVCQRVRDALQVTRVYQFFSVFATVPEAESAAK